MTLNRKHYTSSFRSFPPWRCPTCTDGTLARIDDARKVVETGPSKRAHAHDAWDPDWITERFTDMLSCSNESCGEVVAVSGYTTNSLDYYYGADGNTETELYTYFAPTGFNPAPAIIDIPPATPDEVKEVVHAAFGLYWLDKEACANKLRVAVELLLNDVKIPAVKRSKDGRDRPVGLDTRIREYSAINQEVADLLLAVKWIGNAGSHANLGQLDADDLLDVFEIVELVLEDAYIGKRKRLAAIAAAIVSAKGKPVRTRRKV